MTMFSDRTDEVDAVCCQQAGDPNQCGNSGAPTGCDYECSLMYVPWFNECHELIEQFVGAQLPQFDSTYRQCQNQDPHDVLREIYDLEQQGCAVQLPPGQVDSEALIMLDRELCSENGAAITPVSCTASSEYSDAYLCDNVFDGSSEDGYYANSEGGAGTAGTSWAVNGVQEGNGAGSGPGFHASITLNFGSPQTFGSMIFAQRNNLAGECFGRVVLTFDGQAAPTVPLSLQCTPEMTTYSFPPVTASSVTITAAGTAEGADVINPGAREIQFLSHAGARETTLPIELPRRGFDVGASIVCNGVLDKGRNRFSLNLGIGIGDPGMSGDIALHVNPRFAADGSADVLVLNTRQGGGTWGPEDRDTVQPFRAEQSFQVSVLATHAGYQVSFPGHPEFVGGPDYHGVVPSTHLYPYRMDAALVDTINQEDDTLTTCTYLPPPGVCDESVEAPICAHGSDSFEGGDLQGWHTVNAIGSNDIFPASLIHVPTVAFHGCNSCFGPDHDGDCSQCADGFYFITTDEGTSFDGEDDAPTGVLQSETFLIGDGAQIR
jgi:hypothetical protein